MMRRLGTVKAVILDELKYAVMKYILVSDFMPLYLV